MLIQERPFSIFHSNQLSTHSHSTLEEDFSTSEHILMRQKSIKKITVIQKVYSGDDFPHICIYKQMTEKLGSRRRNALKLSLAGDKISYLINRAMC